jgi:hypothetical protein
LLRIYDKILASDRFTGTYNVAPKEYTTVKEISRKLGKRILYFPYRLIYFICFLLFRLKPSLGVSEHSATYLTYPIIVDSSRIERKLDFKFKYSSLQAFLKCVEAKK